MRLGGAPLFLLVLLLGGFVGALVMGGLGEEEGPTHTEMLTDGEVAPGEAGGQRRGPRGGRGRRARRGPPCVCLAAAGHGAVDGVRVAARRA